MANRNDVKLHNFFVSCSVNCVVTIRIKNTRDDTILSIRYYLTHSSCYMYSQQLKCKKNERDTLQITNFVCFI